MQQCDWFGKHIWLPLISAVLEAEAKIREAGSHCARPDPSGIIAIEDMVWLH